MVVDTALRNTLQQLQQDPRRYKLFGIYWWPMKEFLKAAGYGKDQLYMLGDYRDAITADLVPAMGQEETMRTAFEEYIRNACYPHPGSMVEDPDGQMVMIYDEDAGI
jgi:hypothetical protein